MQFSRTLRKIARRVWIFGWTVGEFLAAGQRWIGSRVPLYARLTHAIARLSAYAFTGDLRFKFFVGFATSPPIGTQPLPPEHLGTIIPFGGSPAPEAAVRSLQLYRRNALGDVLICTPFLPPLRKKYPNAKITFSTLYQEILAGNPHIDEIVKSEEVLPGYDRTIIFDYELDPETRRVDTYARHAGVTIEDSTPQIYLSAEERGNANELLIQSGVDLARPICGFHMASGWAVRDWPSAYFEQVAAELAKMGVQVLLFGDKAEPVVNFGIDLRGKSSMRQVAALISKCTMMLAIDSGLMHIATALRVPVVSLFGCTDPEKVLPDWALPNAIYADIVCHGCHHRQRPVPAIFAPKCPWESVRCMEGIKPELVLSKLRTILVGLEKPKVSIVIPHYNGFKLTNTCLESIFRCGARANFEVLVVDDCSTDQSPRQLTQWLPRIRYLRNAQNLGFAGTCDAGLAAARGKYVVFLNNDTAVTPGWLEVLVGELDTDPQIGMVGPRLLFETERIQHCGSVVNEDGVIEHVFRELPGNLMAANRRRIYKTLTGACLMGRRDELQALGAFDTAYHMGSEDADLCFKYTTAGRPLVYCPTSVVYHYEGVSRGRWDAHHPVEARNRALLRQRWSNVMNVNISDYSLLAVIEGAEGKTWLRLDDVPPDVRAKYDTPENRRFARHPFRFEILGPFEAEPGYIHLGRARPGASIDAEWDISQRLPFASGTVGEIMLKHVIQYLDRDRLAALFREIAPLMFRDGRVHVSTLSANTIAIQSASTLDGKTVEMEIVQIHPIDEIEELGRSVGFSRFVREPFGREWLPGEIQLTMSK